MDAKEQRPIESSRILLPQMSPFPFGYPEVGLQVLEHEPEPKEKLRASRLRAGTKTKSKTLKLTFAFCPEREREEVLKILLEAAIVANGATRIAVDRAHSLCSAVDALDPEYKRRWLLDIKQDPAAMPELQALMRPIAKEFKVEFSDGGFGAHKRVFDALPEDLRTSFMILYGSVYRFFLGMKYKLQIDIPLEATQKALECVLRYSTNLRTRENLHVLQAILNAYEPHGIESLRFNPTASEEQIMRLRELIQDRRLLEDETYMRFSIWGYSLGVPRQVRRALAEIGRWSKRLLRHPRFGQIYEPAAQVIRVPAKAIGVELPSTKALSTLPGQEYLPPIVQFKARLPSFEDWIKQQLKQQALKQGLPASVVEQQLFRPSSKNKIKRSKR
jgi:hypothetical protein